MYRPTSSMNHANDEARSATMVRRICCLIKMVTNIFTALVAAFNWNLWRHTYFFFKFQRYLFLGTVPGICWLFKIPGLLMKNLLKELRIKNTLPEKFKRRAFRRAVEVSWRHEISRRALICSLKLNFRRVIGSYCSHSSFNKWCDIQLNILW